MLEIDHPFTLLKGYVDKDGTLHKEGVMRLATAADEILPMKDARVQALPAYLIVILLARVVTRLGTLPEVNAGVIERLFSADLAYLQDMYNRINAPETRWLAVHCPRCGHAFEAETPLAGGS